MENNELPIIDLIEVKYDDGYRYMTQEEYNRLYKLDDLKNTIVALGSFLFQNRTLAFTAFSFLSGFVSFHQTVQASTKVPGNFTETTVLNQNFDPDTSFQQFMTRTGNVKTNQFKGFGKSYRLGSAEDNQSFVKQPMQKNFFTLATFVQYANSLKQEGIVFRPAILNNVQNVFHSSRLILDLRGGSSLVVSSSFLLSFFVSILGILDFLRKTKKTMEKVKEIISEKEMNPNLLPETVTPPFEIPQKRTWRQYFRTYLDFHTPKPYILLFSGCLLILAYTKGGTVWAIIREKPGLPGLVRNNSEVIQETSNSRKYEYDKILKDLEDLVNAPSRKNRWFK